MSVEIIEWRMAWDHSQKPIRCWVPLGARHFSENLNDPTAIGNDVDAILRRELARLREITVL